MRSSIVPPCRRAWSRLKIAVRAPPTCRKPGGEGAKRSCIVAFQFIPRARAESPTAPAHGASGGSVQPARLPGMTRRENGFSLAELLMALLILTIVMTTSMAAFLERNRRQQQAREIVAVYQALANEAEYWRRLPYATLENYRAFQGDHPILSTLGSYNEVVAVAVTQPNVKKVTLTVRWQEGKRQARLGVVRVDTGGTNLW